jgi:hypothetical protein
MENVYSSFGKNVPPSLSLALLMPMEILRKNEALEAVAYYS